MTSNPTLDAARIAFDRREWTAAATAFAAADADGSLDAFDLGHAGLAAHLTGDDDLAAALMTRSHQAAVAAADTDFAALMAFWLGMMLANRGDVAVAGGWLARAARLVEERGEDSVVAGYLCVPQALQALEGGDPASALAL